MKLTVKLPHAMKSFCLCGNTAELGEWDICKALKVESVRPKKTHVVDIHGDNVEFKVVSTFGSWLGVERDENGGDIANRVARGEKYTATVKRF